MRHSFLRVVSVAVLYAVVLFLPPSSFGTNNHSKKQTRSSGKTTPETVLLTSEGSALKVEAQISKDRRAPGLPTTPNPGSPPAQARSWRATGRPREDRLLRGHAFHGDVRTLPQIPPTKFELPERDEPQPRPILAPGTQTPTSSQGSVPTQPVPSGPAPAPTSSFDGLDFATWGAGHPPDTNGDVGPTYYIQTINTSVGIYQKSDGTRVAAFTFNTLMSQGNFGNLCDTNNFGDPVVLYDSFEDRWVITDFAFTLDGSNNVVAPTFQCFAVSKSGDPVAGGWNFYSIQINNALGDYPKFGVWTDGIYMSANLFTAGAGSSFVNA